MRRWTLAALVAAALGGAAAQAPSASAAAAAPGVSQHAALLHAVQYYGERPYGGDWGPRHHWREHRRARDEARIAEAARREAYRIQQERAYRRAARYARRDHYGHYRGY
jgi:Spy/CpxP family protein refolding chaperone